MNENLGKKSVHLFMAKAVSTLVPFAIAMVLSRYCDYGEYGTYAQLLLVINLITAVFMLGLPSSINYFLALTDSEHERREYLSVFYSAITVLSLVIGIVMILIEPIVIRYFGNEEIGKYLYFMAIFPWASVVISGVENILVVYQRTKAVFAFRFAYCICVLSLLLAVYLWQLSFGVFLSGYLCISGAFAIAVYCISAKLSGGLRISFKKDWIRRIIVFALPLGLAGMIGTLDIEVDKLLIGYLMTTEELAVYTNAAKELPVSIISAAITAVMLPTLTKRLAEGKKEEAVSLWGEAIEIALIFIALLAFGVFTFGNEVLTILYSEKYIGGVAVFRVYSVALICRCTYFGMVLNAMGETKKILYSSIFALVLNMVLNPLFYYIFGMVGPAIATLLSVVLVLLLQLRLTSKALEVPFGKVFPWKEAACILGVNLVFSFLFGFLKTVLPLESAVGEVWESVLLGIVWSMLYLFIYRKRLQTIWKNLNRGAVEI